MPKVLRLGICGALWLGLVSAAAAQADRPAPTRASPARPAPAHPPQAAHPQAQAQSPGAQPAPAAAAPAPAAPPAPPLRTEIWNFDNWSTTCSEFEDKRKVCSARLQVAPQGRNVVLVWVITLNAENQAISMLQTPTGVSIPQGVEIRLGKAAPRKVPFTTCETGNCTATLPVDRTLVRDMTMAPEAEVVIYAPNGAGVQFKFPLKGFDKAYGQLSR